MIEISSSLTNSKKSQKVVFFLSFQVVVVVSLKKPGRTQVIKIVWIKYQNNNRGSEHPTYERYQEKYPRFGVEFCEAYNKYVIYYFLSF